MASITGKMPVKLVSITSNVLFCGFSPIYNNTEKEKKLNKK